MPAQGGGLSETHAQHAAWRQGGPRPVALGQRPGTRAADALLALTAAAAQKISDWPMRPPLAAFAPCVTPPRLHGHHATSSPWSCGSNWLSAHHRATLNGRRPALDCGMGECTSVLPQHRAGSCWSGAPQAVQLSDRQLVDRQDDSATQPCSMPPRALGLFFSISLLVASCDLGDRPADQGWSSCFLPFETPFCTAGGEGWKALFHTILPVILCLPMCMLWVTRL